MNQKIKVIGKVQGVFFRKNTQDKALELGIKGWVQNEPDGTVLAEIEGTDEQVLQMLNWLQKGPGRAKVDEIKVLEKGKEKGYTHFDIRH